MQYLIEDLCVLPATTAGLLLQMRISCAISSHIPANSQPNRHMYLKMRDSSSNIECSPNAMLANIRGTCLASKLVFPSLPLNLSLFLCRTYSATSLNYWN